jgi:hypothetical protein
VIVVDILCHVYSDPLNANVVTSVCLEPWHEEFEAPRGTWPRRLWASINNFLAPGATAQKLEDYAAKKYRKHIQRVVNTLRGLPSVNEYAIVSAENTVYHPDMFAAFIDRLMVETPFARNLTKLKLRLPPDKMSRMASARLPNLEVLDVHFATGATSTLAIQHHTDGFVTFVNNLKETLRSLSVSTSRTSTNLDLTPFYHRLGTFSRLSSFSLLIPADGSHLSDLNVVTRFLEKHVRTLEVLRLAADEMMSYLPRGRVIGAEAKLWLPNLVHSLTELSLPLPIDDLRVVELGLRPLRDDYMSRLSGDIAALAGNIERLVLSELALSLAEVRELLQTVNVGRLQHLSLRVQCLSPELLLFLSQQVTHLPSLSLAFKTMTSHDNGQEDLPPAVICLVSFWRSAPSHSS